MMFVGSFVIAMIAYSFTFHHVSSACASMSRPKSRTPSRHKQTTIAESAKLKWSMSWRGTKSGQAVQPCPMWDTPPFEWKKNIHENIVHFKRKKQGQDVQNDLDGLLMQWQGNLINTLTLAPLFSVTCRRKCNLRESSNKNVITGLVKRAILLCHVHLEKKTSKLPRS